VYSQKVLDHFNRPRHAGEIANPSVVLEAANPVCSDTLKLWVRIEGAIIAEARFKAQGCVPAIACGSWLAEWLTGKEIAQLRALSAEEIEADLDGLPAASHHAAVLAAECLRGLLAKIR
jgi:NifU-like protein involved in Fe-S cluster formation